MDLLDVILAVLLTIYLSVLASRNYIRDFSFRDFLTMLVTSFTYVIVLKFTLMILTFIWLLHAYAIYIALSIGILAALWVLLGKPAQMAEKKIRTFLLALSLSYATLAIIIWLATIL